MNKDKIVAVFFDRDGSLDEVKVLCRVPAGTTVLGCDLLTLTPCVVLSVLENEVVEPAEGRVEEWPSN